MASCPRRHKREPARGGCGLSPLSGSLVAYQRWTALTIVGSLTLTIGKQRDSL